MAVSVAAGSDRNTWLFGLPVVGGLFAEAKVLLPGYAYEQAAGWYRRHPARF